MYLTDVLESLELKSADATSSRSAPYAVLCTRDHTYQLRQVQSSNSVFVLSSSQTSRSHDSLDRGACVTAIAKCSDTLELLPANTSAYDFLRQVLPIYDGGLEQLSNDKQYESKAKIFEDAPYSFNELEKAWLECCAFEANGGAYLPTAQSCASAWKAIVLAATLCNLDLSKAFAPHSLTGTIEDDGHCRPLFQSILAHLSTSSTNVDDDQVQLHAERSISWVGTVLLESIGKEVQINNFLSVWREQLPESWHGQTSLNMIEGLYSKPSKGWIVYDKSNASIKSNKTAASATTVKNSRKWHEKFKSARDQ